MRARALVSAGPRKWTGFATLGLAIIVALVINEGFFRIAARYQARVADVALEGLLQREDLLSNPYLLSQSVSDLEGLGLLECASISSKTRPEVAEFISNRGNSHCSQRPWYSPKIVVNRTLQAGNGEQWSAHYTVVMGPGFVFGLWGARFLWTILIIVFWVALRSRIRHEQAVVALKDAHAEELFGIASQVSHDIRSPLAALSAAERELAGLSEDTRLILRGATQRIRDIANQLLEKNRHRLQSSDSGQATAVEVFPLGSLIDPIVSEKRMQFRSEGTRANEPEVVFDMAETYDLFVAVDSVEFKRLISNLMNNALESYAALSSRPYIRISAMRNALNQVEVRVSDKGSGIDESVLKKIGQRGSSFGKLKGTGLGLFYARTQVESWGGQFQIESRFGQGTDVILRLPAAAPPAWFVDRIEVSPGFRVAILDDDPGIHEIWKLKLKGVDSTIRYHHFQDADSFSSWCKDNEADLYLCDFELGADDKNGLDIIEELRIGRQSILVTSLAEEKSVRQRCLSQDIRLLPKVMAAHVPIVCSARNAT